jgi:hypothetical protein
VTNWGAGVNADIGLGLTFKLNDHFSVDGYTNTAIGSPAESEKAAINLWDDFVATTYNVLFALKF